MVEPMVEEAEKEDDAEEPAEAEEEPVAKEEMDAAPEAVAEPAPEAAAEAEPAPEAAAEAVSEVAAIAHESVDADLLALGPPPSMPPPVPQPAAAAAAAAIVEPACVLAPAAAEVPAASAPASEGVLGGLGRVGGKLLGVLGGGKATIGGEPARKGEGGGEGRAAAQSPRGAGFRNAGHETCDALQNALAAKRPHQGPDAPMPLQQSMINAAVEPEPAAAAAEPAADAQMADTDDVAVQQAVAAAAAAASEQKPQAGPSSSAMEVEEAAPAPADPPIVMSKVKQMLGNFESKDGGPRRVPVQVPKPGAELKRKPQEQPAGHKNKISEMAERAAQAKQRQADQEERRKAEAAEKVAEKERATQERIKALKDQKAEEAKEKKEKALQHQEQKRLAEETKRREAAEKQKAEEEETKRKAEEAAKVAQKLKAEAAEKQRAEAEEAAKAAAAKKLKAKQQQQRAPLPKGWTAHTDPATNKEYYHNKELNETTWKRPDPLLEAASVGSSSDMIPIDKEADSGSESEEEVPPQNYPKWTWKSSMAEALEKQQQLDGEAIFDTQLHNQATAIELTDVFGPEGQKKKRYHKRGSSGNWTGDRLLPKEEEEYKKKMGFFGR